MSIESWMAEFYPVPASEAVDSDEEALAHSLRKWEGALPENLARHGVAAHFTNTVIVGDVKFGIETCALCQRHDVVCSECPIMEETGLDCVGGAYDDVVRQEDPTPMINLLRRVRAARGGK